jgi:hypothetical protein
MSGLAARLAVAVKASGGRHSTRPKFIPFGEWMPDLPPWANPGAITATNVIPNVNSYGPFPDLEAVASALSDRARGAIAAKDASGNVYLYVGTASMLNSLGTGTFSDVSVVGGYATTAENYWEFCQYRGDVMATNLDNLVQTITPGDANFADLITSTLKPKAKHMDVVGDFLMLGNTNDTTDGAVPHRVWWSALGDPALFDPDASTQSDYQNLGAGGHIQRILGGREYALIFCESMIYRAQYVGAGLVFYIAPVEAGRGTPIPGSVVALGRMVFYVGEDDFYVFDGAGSTPLGLGKVAKTFRTELDASSYHRVYSAIDPINQIAMWAYPGENSQAGLPNRIIMVHWPTRKWARAEIDVEMIFPSYTKGLTLEELDAFGTLETLSDSLDSRRWMGGKFRLAAFDESHVLSNFTGSNLAATIDTAEFPLNQNGRGVLSRIRPRVDGGTVTLQVAGRRTLQDTVTFGTAASLNSDGEAAVLVDAMFHRIRANIAAGGSWNFIDGCDVFAATTSRR